MLVSSLGRAWLSWCSDDEREATLVLLGERTDAIGEMARNTKYVARVLRETRKRGYATNRGEWLSESSVTAIGLPIRNGEHAIGAINLVMQTNAVSDRDIAQRYVPLLRDLAEEISKGVTAPQSK